MEISDMNVISAGINSLQNPSLISGFSDFWKWAAVVVAILATSSSVIKRIKIIFIHLHTVKPSPQVFVQSEDFEFSDDDDCSSVSSDEEEEGNSPTTSFEDDEDVDEDFGIKGSNFHLKIQRQNSGLEHMRRRCRGGERERLWSQFTSGKNVVKLWDSLGLGLDIFEENQNADSKSVVSIWDFNKDELNNKFTGWNWTIPVAASPKMLLTAKRNKIGDGLVLGGHDMRMRREIPVITAEWRSPAAAEAEMVAVAIDGVEKVYAIDNVTGALTIGDVRNVKALLTTTAESDGETL